jgi:hypothetical protein
MHRDSLYAEAIFLDKNTTILTNTTTNELNTIITTAQVLPQSILFGIHFKYPLVGSPVLSNKIGPGRPYTKECKIKKIISKASKYRENLSRYLPVNACELTRKILKIRKTL